MPQFTRFLFMPTRDPHASVDALIGVCKDMPVEGEGLKAFRARMREVKLWERERSDDIFRFLHLAPGDHLVPSEFMRKVAEAAQAEASEEDPSGSAARRMIAERLWHVNPLLFKAVMDMTQERAHLRDEIHTYLDSFAYRGDKVSRPQVEDWLRMALGLDLLKVVGIAIAPGDQAEPFAARAKELDVDEFLEEDEPEPVLGAPIEVGAAAGDAAEPEASRPSATAKPLVPTVSYSSPRGRFRPVQIAVLRSGDSYGKETLDETAQRIREWWSEQDVESSGPYAHDFGLSSEQWMENAEETLYRLAVAAAMVFRLGRDSDSVVRAYTGLDGAGVLSDLYFGTAPDVLPEQVDAQALMLASLVARRCAESQELSNELEKASDGAQAFAVLERVLGGGLFSIELFWIMRSLQELGAIRAPDIAEFTALPTRPVRDALYRLGFLDSPYAPDSASLVTAAKAARALAGEVSDARQMIEGFAAAAMCTYDCQHRKKCEFACRERSDAAG